jgi:hypothetical protein
MSEPVNASIVQGDGVTLLAADNPRYGGTRDRLTRCAGLQKAPNL